jgi:hypothetical protein
MGGSSGSAPAKTVWARCARLVRLITPREARVTAAILYLTYWLVIAGLVSTWPTTVVLVAWLASTLVLLKLIGRRGALLAAGACIGVVAIAFALWGRPTARLDDASAVALVAYADNYEPDAGLQAVCDSRPRVNLPGRVTYHCRAGYCKHQNQPVYVIRVTVRHYVLVGRWTFSKSPGGLGPRHGSVSPGRVAPVNCSEIGS